MASVLHHLDPTPLVGKRMFITGGTGFFGFWLLSALSVLNQRGAGIHATVLSRDPAAFLSRQPAWSEVPGIAFVRGNVRDFDFPAGAFDLLIHAATDTSAAANARPLSIFDDIVQGTRRVLDFAVQAGIQRALLTSSGAVYGPQPQNERLIPEQATFACLPQMASSAYGEGKRVMELLGALYQRDHGIESVIARCFAFVGPGLPLDGHFAIGNFIRDGLFADAIQVNGDGTPIRSYLYGADLAVWLLDLLGHGKSNHPYNVGSDEAISIRELAGMVQQIVSPDKACHVQTLITSENEIRNRYVPAIERARTERHLDVFTTLPQAIEWTAEFHRRRVRSSSVSGC